jgi:hypothetical protein
VNNCVQAQTVLRLLASFQPVNAFMVGRLAGCGERDAQRILADLQRGGLVDLVDERWSLTAAGHAALKPAVSECPGSIARAKRVRLG